MTTASGNPTLPLTPLTPFTPPPTHSSTFPQSSHHYAAGMQTSIDLRSDTVTRPTDAMRDAMMQAPLGDDVLGDDPTIQALQHKFSALVGKEASLFVPSGTMANQLAIRSQTEPGDEIICHEESHIIHYETGGPAAISGCMIRPLRGPRGTFTASDVTSSIRPDNAHFAVARLVVIENTQNRGGGAVWNQAQIQAITDAAHTRGLRCHLDGARLWNAHIASGLSMKDLAAPFNTLCCCFSKGLGAPVGSIIAGDARTIHRAHRFRKMLGGAMRQSGLLAAAAIHAMDHHVQRLALDHEHARLFASIAAAPGSSLRLHPDQAAQGPETNIVYLDLPESAPLDAAELCKRLESRGVLMLATGPRRVRAVMHLDVSREQANHAATEIKACAA